MDRILIILKKENGPRASSSPALGLNTIIFKHVYWYMQQISGECLQGHWSSGFTFGGQEYKFFLKNLRVLFAFVQTLQICVVCDSYTQVFYASNIFQYSSLKGVIRAYTSYSRSRISTQLKGTASHLNSAQLTQLIMLST